jgi:hypothetical protein
MSPMRISLLLGLVVSLGAVATAQTTDGLISGRLVNSVSGAPIPGARIVFSSSFTTIAGGAVSDSSGYYLLPLLSPGMYQIRVTATGFQAQEVQDIELTVAASIDLDFRLRPLNDVWEAGQYNSVFLPGSKTIVTFYGPDVDTTKTGSFEAQKGRSETLESTVSEVIDRTELDELPLEGRDVYTLLVTQPGVTSDAGTARGLGLSINGTRPTSSNFMLDGLENNNYLTTGPLTTVAPEATQEYRVSTNNFSAEYGRTGGYVANAITRSGGDQYHGIVYYYTENDALNANSFQQNLIGAPRIPDKQIQPGYFVGGPILKNRLFFSSAFEDLRSHSFQGPATFLLPSTNFFSIFPQQNTPLSNLLAMYPAPAVSDGVNPLATYTVAPPVVVNRILGIERLDYTTPSGRDRIMARGIFVRMKEPDFIWSPYQGFTTPLIENTFAIGGSYIHEFSASFTNEFRLSRTDDDLYFNRPNPQVPTLLAEAPSNYYPIANITLPGSSQFYSYKNHSKTTELVDNVILSRGRHLITLGGGFLFRNVSGYLTAGQDGEYTFDGLFNLALNLPNTLTVTIERDSPAGAAIQPNYNREYAYNQFDVFAQDSWRLTPRLTVNYGIRYENYGSPSNVGPNKDTLLQLGTGANMNEQLANATLVTPTSGNEQLFGVDNLDIGVRVGASYDLFGTGRTLLRGGFGTFYDRPYDNLWQDLRSNDYVLSAYSIPGTFNYLASIPSVLPGLAQSGPLTQYAFPNVTLISPNLLNGRISSYFAGIQQRVTNNFIIEVNGLGTYGRNLVTTDIINRPFTTADGTANPNLPEVNYRANQGYSDYNALTVVARYRWSRGYIQASYTWSHYIDNQSDPLTGDFFDLSFTNINSGSGTGGQAAFSQQFNPNSDRGNSDYDQPQNLVLFSYWNLPPALQGSKAGIFLRGWIVAGLAAFRSGLPYTVIDNASPVIPGDGTVINPRPDLILPNPVLANPTQVPGGEQLLNPAAFAGVSNALGTLGRNSLIGPGIYNIDLSLARTFAIPWFGESGRLTFRADAFNILNHANLNNPDPLLGDTSTFGSAQFGRLGDPSGFPAVSPLNETPRVIQILLKVQF